MKNTKPLSIILAVLSIVSMILDTVDLVPFGWSLDTIGQITAVVAMIKIIIENTSLFNAQDVADFANEKTEDAIYKSHQSMVTVQDVKNWKSNK